jgi:hypothetical protein
LQSKTQTKNTSFQNNNFDFKHSQNETTYNMATTQILQPYDPSHFNTIPYLHEVSKSFQAKNGAEFVEKVFKPLILKHNLESQLGIGLLHRHFDLKGFEKLVELNNISTPWAVKGEDHMDGKILPCSWLISGGGKLMPYEFFFSPGPSDGEPDGSSGSSSGSGNGGAGGSGSNPKPRPVIDSLDLTESGSGGNGGGSGGGDGGGSGGGGSGGGSGGGFDPNVYKSLDLTESRVRAFLDEFLLAMEFHDLNGTLALRLFPGPSYAAGHEITHGRTNIVLTPEQASADYRICFHLLHSAFLCPNQKQCNTNTVVNLVQGS